MTIHHDKLAYGKLAANMEELSDDDILKMLGNLNDDETDEEDNNSNEDKKD